MKPHEMEKAGLQADKKKHLRHVYFALLGIHEM